jgi:cytochrome c556
MRAIGQTASVPQQSYSLFVYSIDRHSEPSLGTGPEAGKGARTMHGIAIAAAGLLVLSGLEVLAQQEDPKDPIHQRQELMKNNQEQMRALTGMSRGQVPFNVAMAQAALQQIEQNARLIPSLFLAGSEQGSTAALPIILERKADFDARAAKLEQDAKAALAGVSSQASLQAAIQQIGQNCGACHETYRRKER